MLCIRTEAGKFRAIVRQMCQACHEKGQPVLVGTVSIEKSELFSRTAESGASSTTC